MSVRLYLTDATTESAGIASTPLAVTVPDPDLDAGRVRDLSPTISTGPRQSPNLTSLAQTALQRLLFGKWVSPPLSGVSSIDANLWTIAHVGREGNNQANQSPCVVLYVLKADGTVRGFIYDVDAAQGAELPTVTPPPAQVYTVSGSAVAGIVSTDRLVAEFYTRGAQSSATSYAIRGINYNGTVIPVDGVTDTTGDEATYIQTPQDGLFDPGTPPPPPEQTKLYLRATTDQVAGYALAEKSAAMSPAAEIAQAHDLLEQIGVSPGEADHVDPLTPGLSRFYFGKWITMPLVGLTGGSVPAGDWEVAFAGDGAVDHHAFFGVSIYVLKADDTVRGYVYDADVSWGSEMRPAMRGRVFTVPGAAVSSIAIDDRLVVEMWMRADVPAVPDRLRVRYDGGVEPLEGVNTEDAASYVIAPAAAMFGASATITHAGTITPAGTHAFALAGDLPSSGTITPAGTHVLELASSFALFAGTITPHGEHSFSVLRYSDPCDPGDVQWWMTYCGNEVSNLARTWEYLKRYRPRDIEIICAPNGVLYRVAGQTGDEPVFNHPSTDPAPWFDAGRPESAEFLGFVGKPVPQPALARSVTRRGSGGAALGPLRVTERVVEVSGFLFAVTSRGLDYGFRWLSDLIAGEDDCATCEIEIMTAAPLSDGSDDSVGRWRMFETGLAEPGLQETERYCAEAMAVSFKMVAGDGYLYKDPDLVLPLEPLPDVAITGCVPWSLWMCEAPDAWLYAAVNPPASGSSGTVVTIDCLDSGINGVRIDAMTDCDDGEILSTMRTEAIPEGAVLVIDSAREIITYISPDGVLSDGSLYIHLPAGETIPWVVLRQADGARCIRIGRDRYCSTGTDQVRVAVQTQERRR